MVNYVIIGSEVDSSFIKLLYNIENLNEPIILGELQNLSYYRGLYNFDTVYYKSNEEITSIEQFDLDEFVVLTDYDYLKVLDILYNMGIKTFRFKCMNPYTEVEDTIEDSVALNKYFKLQNLTKKLWTELFTTLDDEVRLLISANVPTVINSSKTSTKVFIDFDNLNYVPNQYERNSKIDKQCIFNLGSQELKSAERRFIKGTTFNINKITIENSIGNFELNTDKPNSYILDSTSLTDVDIEFFFDALINRKLKHIYYTNTKLESDLIRLGLDKISTRWEYAI